MITIGTIIILSGIEPLILLIIAASGGGVVMAFYSTMLLVLNRRALPDPIKLKSYRLVIIAFSSVMFIGLSIYLLYAVAMGRYRRMIPFLRERGRGILEHPGRANDIGSVDGSRWIANEEERKSSGS